MNTERSLDANSEMDGRLALREAERLAVISTPIPVWPERASSVLSLLFVVLVVDAPADSSIFKAMIIGTFVGAMSCIWFTASRLRQKIEALCELGKSKG